VSTSEPALYAVHTRPVGLWTPHDELLARHITYLRELEARGGTFLSGPLGFDTNGWNGEGLTILRAGSLAEAEALMATEPLAAAGVRSHDVSPWVITSGRLTIDLALAAQTAAIS